MKYENGKLAVHFTDILKVLFFPFYLFWLGAQKLEGKYESSYGNTKEWWGAACLFYWLGTIVLTVFLTLQFVTFNREVVAVEYKQDIPDPVVSKETEVKAVIMTLEERPKVFNTDQVKIWRFCRAADGRWFEITDDGELLLVENGLGGIWEWGKQRYLADKLTEWEKKKKEDKALLELKATISE